MSAGRPSAPVVWSALALCMAVGPLMLYSLSAVSPLVIADLGLSPSQYGAVATLTFAAAAAGCVVVGPVSERARTDRVMVAVSLGAGAGLLLVAVAPAFAWVVVGALVCGVAQSVSNPATNRYVSGLAPRQRNALIGWKQSGVQMSQLTAGLLAPVLALHWGWRFALTAGVVVCLAGALTAALLGSSAPGSQSAVPLTSAAVDAGRHDLAAVRPLRTYTFFVAAGLAATNAYLPLYAHQQLGFGVGTAALTAALLAVIGLASRIWWGRREIPSRAVAPTLAALAMCSTLGAVATVTAQAGLGLLVWVGSALFGISALAANSVTMVTLVSLVPAEVVGVASGSVATGLYLGFAAGPLLFGLLLESGSYWLGWLLPATSFAVAAVVPLGARATFTNPAPAH